ncbi:MAG: SPOR domain-containing protein [Saprospiraceae bacterium]
MPGIGYFHADKIAASINSDSTSISPTKLLLHFEPLAHQKTENMVDNIISETGYSRELIEQSIANLIYHFGTELRIRNEVQFEPLGKLYYSKTSNILQFEATKTNIHDQFFNLSELPLIPLQEINTVLLSKKTENIISKPISKNTGINRNLIYLLVLLWLLFLGLLLCPAKNTTTVTTTLPSQPRKDTLSSQIISPAINPTIDSSIKSKAINIDTVPVKKAIPNDFKNETEIKDSNVVQLQSKVQNKKCVIIVGSFKKISNARKQIKQVKATKYKVYTENFGEFHRVGVQFDCMTNDLNKVLAQLKKKFSPDAWILKY